MTVRWTWDADPAPGRFKPDFLRALRQNIDAVLDENQQDYLDFLSDLLGYPTISGALDREGQRRFRDAMDECMTRVEKQASDLGLEWRTHDGIAAVAEWPGRRGQHKSVGIAAHLDVVPPGGTWRHPAFGGDRVDDEIWGRGAQDDKGAVAMTFAACDVLRRLGLEPKSDIRMLMGTQEETDDWPDIDLLLEREEPPELTLVPDGAFPVIVGEKGLLTVEWRASWAPERKDELRFVGLRGGERHNLVPSRATFWIDCPAGKAQHVEARLRRLQKAAEVRPARDPPPAVEQDACFEVVFKGKAAHGAFPEQGHNAALDALEALVELFGDRGPGRFARFLFDRCSASDASGLGLDQAHTRMGETTLNLGLVELGPGNGHVQLSVRFPLGLRLDEVKKRFRDAAQAPGDDLRVDYMTRGRPHEAIFISPEDHPHLIHALQAAYRTGTGRAPTLASIAGTTYAKVFPLALAFGPQDESAGEPILAHRTDERVAVSRFMENVRVYAVALALLAFDLDEVENALAGPSGEALSRHRSGSRS